MSCILNYCFNISLPVIDIVIYSTDTPLLSVLVENSAYDKTTCIQAVFYFSCSTPTLDIIKLHAYELYSILFSVYAFNTGYNKTYEFMLYSIA